MSTATASMVRAHLVRALEVDLIGPYEEHEKLDRAPSRFYLTGFLVPREGRRDEPLVEPEDDTESEDAEAGDAEATPDTLRDTIRFNPPVRADLGGLDLDAVWSVLDAVRRNETPPPPPLRPAEYAYVQGVPFGQPGDAPDDEEREAHFFARRFAPPEALPDGIERIVLIHELREVRAQVGFTRLAPLEANLEGDVMIDKIRTAALGHLTDWLPAIEDHGEGL